LLLGRLAMDFTGKKNWLLAPSVKGMRALLLAIAAVAIPALFREAVDEIAIGITVTPFIPFVLISAVFLGTGYALFVTFASAVVADAFFIGPPRQFLESPNDLFAIGLFLIAAGMIIGLVAAMRKLLNEARRPALPAKRGGIVFSLEDGKAWANWYGKASPVYLGPSDQVAEMMQDFLAQLELGKRLECNCPATPSAVAQLDAS
jgi:Domain of unknown function (DUF4118)